MSKSQVPRGATKKVKCKKCGKLDWYFECRNCNPKLYESKKIK